MPMSMDVAVYLNALIGLMVIIDPIGSSLLFHALVPDDDKTFRLKMALKSVLISCGLLILFGNFGEPLLKELGIGIDALLVSGGILLFYTAFHMITKAEGDEAVIKGKQDISVYPMSIPLLAGPGALTLCILLYSQASTHPQPHAATWAITAAIVTTLFVTFIALVTSRWIKRIVGKTGDDILKRFLGILLAALAIQFIHDGVLDMLAQAT